MAEKQIKELQMRIVELENQLKAVAEARRPVDISADDIRAYRKVRDAVASDLSCSCTNPCVCVSPTCEIDRYVVRCITRCITRCDVECSCGPCTIRGGRPGSTFEQFGL